MYEYTAFVVRVVDGDTIDVIVDLGFHVQTKVRLRLKDIDTPEIYRPSSQMEKEQGRKAKEFVEERILNKVVNIVTYKDRQGKYGRFLADIVYRDEDNISHFLIDELKKAGYDKNPIDFHKI